MQTMETERARELACVLIVSDDPAIRGFARNTLITETRYLFDCKLADMEVMIRSFKIDVLVVIGERTRALIEKVRDVLAGVRIPARRVAVVDSAADVRDVALQALEA
jgi:hypothetical protein